MKQPYIVNLDVFDSFLMFCAQAGSFFKRDEGWNLMAHIKKRDLNLRFLFILGSVENLSRVTRRRVRVHVKCYLVTCDPSKPTLKLYYSLAFSFVDQAWESITPP